MKTTRTHILVVDDTPQNLLVMEKYLNSPEIEVIKASSGNEALGFVLDYDFALILMDVQMPEMDGFETAELIRQNDESKHVPIIFITAINKEQKHIFKGYESGAVDYMFKPFNPDILLSKVSVFIQLHNQKIELQTINERLEERVKERTRTLNIEKKRAEQANIAKSRFLNNISHELLTPLHGIISFSRFGMQSSQREEHKKILNYFVTIEECGNRLQTLLQDLLSLTHYQSGYTSYFMRETCIVSTLNTVVANMPDLIEKNMISIDIETTPINTTVCCDHEKISKLFRELIDNAIKYSDQNRTITISFKKGNLTSGEQSIPALQIAIQDQGIGIPAEELISIFETFKESSFTESKAGGRGLGLAICWEIVKAHHGEIWAENLEKGAVFKILLPYLQPDSKQNPVDGE